ncbi:MAG TPA: hypothetical protein VGK16_13735 [Candidatus Limnocylindrales bacterium]|jgi:hypothetical protein
MSSTRAVPVSAGPASTSPEVADSRPRGRRRFLFTTAGVSIASLGLLVDLLLAGHTVGEELWGPATAATATVVGVLSLAFLVVRSRSRAARLLLYGLWAMVAFFGVGGFNDHRLPRPADTVTDQRQRPPLAPLAFTGLAIVGAIALRNGSKGA